LLRDQDSFISCLLPKENATHTCVIYLFIFVKSSRAEDVVSWAGRGECGLDMDQGKAKFLSRSPGLSVDQFSLSLPTALLDGPVLSSTDAAPSRPNKGIGLRRIRAGWFHGPWQQITLSWSSAAWLP